MSQPQPDNAQAAASTSQLEMASVLFMDIVGYSLEPMERQSGLLHQLQNIVRETEEFRQGQENNGLISLPTGDGMALVFFSPPVTAVECAIKVSRALKNYPDIRLRIGVHMGPVYRISDINANMNVAGGGINMAQRVMDCGDAGHILLSSAVADILSHLGGWPKYIHDLGEHAVKHGVRLHIYALCTDEVGSREIPKKMQSQKAAADPVVSTRRTPVLLGAAAAALAAVAVAGWQLGWFATKSKEPVAGTTAEQRELSYWVMVQRYRDGKLSEPFRLAKDMVFEPEYRIQLGFRSPQAGNLYLFNEGPVPVNGQTSYHMLFPSRTANNQSPGLPPDTEVLFPPAGSRFLRFDSEEGTEKLWMVWSKNDPPELAALRTEANFATGTIKDPTQIAALKAFLNKHAASKPISEEDENLKRTTLRSSGDLLVFLRHLEHH